MPAVPVTIHSGTNANMCLDVSAFRTDDNAPILHFECNGAPNQVFTLRFQGEIVLDHYPWNGAVLEQYQIVSNWSGKCLDVLGERTNSGAQVLQKTCNDHRSQQWLSRASLGGQNFFFNANTVYGLLHNPRCLDVPGATTGRAVMQIWSCNGTAAQNFTFVLA